MAEFLPITVPSLLPNFVVLAPNHNTSRHLSYVNEPQIGREISASGFLEFSGVAITSPLVKFQVERSNTSIGAVHLRSCYNNKYWVARSLDSVQTKWVLAAGNEAQEDVSNPNCTLFRVNGNGSDLIQLTHVSSGASVVERENNLLGTATTTPTTFKVTDWSTLVILPKYIALKGDNGRYLAPRMSGGWLHMVYASDDIGDPSVPNEVFPVTTDSVRFRNPCAGQYWHRSSNSNWILPLSDGEKAEDVFVLTWVDRDNDIVAIRNSSNNNFCARASEAYWNHVDCLRAIHSSITNVCRVQLQEPVTMRRIDNVRYRIDDARIYNERAIVVSTGTTPNPSNSPMTLGVTINYTQTNSRTWNASISLTKGVTVSVTAGVPLLTSAGIEISTSLSIAFEWGRTEETSTSTETTIGVEVPPNQKVTVSALATMANYDVHFSYVQRDTLYSGGTIVTAKDDGVFTGVNTFSVYFQPEFEPI